MIKTKDIMRAGHVTRWQIVRTARHQTLAEHMFLVAHLAEHIYEVTRPATYKTGSAERLLLLQWAMRHDMPEVLIGDLATPLKKKIRSLVEYDPVESIECGVDPVYKDLLRRVKGSVIYAIVKIADLQEAIAFLSTEGLGAHAQAVKGKMIMRHTNMIGICRADFPDWNWHLCVGILDDLLRGEDGMMELEGENI